jgi:hypothetical protein
MRSPRRRDRGRLSREASYKRDGVRSYVIGANAKTMLQAFTMTGYLRTQAFTRISASSTARSSGLGWAARAPRVEKVCLAVLSGNYAAETLYVRMGFVVEGRRVKASKRDEGTYDDEALMYRWVK